MAKIRIRAPKGPVWLSQSGGLANMGNVNRLFAEGAPAESKPAVRDTTGVSDAVKTREYASGWVVLLSYILIVLGVWLGSLLASRANAVTFVPDKDALDSIGFLALFFIMAQAIERLMEPIAELNLKFIGSARKIKSNQRDMNIKAAEEAGDGSVRQENADAAATSEAEANQIAANTKVFIWALASLAAMLASGATRVYFLQAIGFNGIDVRLNILITGLVIGGGTKPLHDLIKLIEKKRDASNGEEDDEGGTG